jgi:hypothetical protein
MRVFSFPPTMAQPIRRRRRRQLRRRAKRPGPPAMPRRRAYLHPLAKATQVKHILGAAAHAARAAELIAGVDHNVGTQHIEQARQRATPALLAVLNRYPAAPAGGNRVAQLLHALDTALRSG